jgi:hypothetical protein
MIEVGEQCERGSLEAVVGGVAAEKEPIVGLAVEALHVRGSRAPTSFHRRADKRRVLDVAKNDQLLATLEIRPDTNRKLGKPREKPLLLHEPPP